MLEACESLLDVRQFLAEPFGPFHDFRKQLEDVGLRGCGFVDSTLMHTYLAREAGL